MGQGQDQSDEVVPTRQDRAAASVDRSSVLAVRPTRRAKCVQLDEQLAHRRWGHASKPFLEKLAAKAGVDLVA